MLLSSLVKCGRVADTIYLCKGWAPNVGRDMASSDDFSPFFCSRLNNLEAPTRGILDQLVKLEEK